MAHTGFAQTTRDYGRIGTNVRKSLVDEVLPEHFREDYPNLITFLDAYYEHLDSADNFGGIIQELQTFGLDIRECSCDKIGNTITYNINPSSKNIIWVIRGYTTIIY